MTPPDSNGRRFDDVTQLGPEFNLFPTESVSSFRESFLFSTAGSALEFPGGGNGRNDGDVYETVRAAPGWQTIRRVTPTGAEAVTPYAGGVSSDHEYGFVFVPRLEGAGSGGSLAREGEAEFLGDPSGAFELVGVGSLGVERFAHGRFVSPGGEHVIFSTGNSEPESGWCLARAAGACPVKKLEPEAPPNGTGAVYDRAADGPTHVVSLLPGGLTPAAGEDALYQGASADGAVVAFKIKGTLYIRVDNSKSEEVASGNATFGGLSADGSYVFYVSGGNIHRFATGTGANEEVNSSGDAKMVSVSADGSHIYFISPSLLDGAEGTLGEPNMYVWSGSSPRFVATVAVGDTEGMPALTNWTDMAVAPSNGQSPGPGGASSRTTPDGDVIVFESRKQLAGYDNAGHNEIYRYDESEEDLQCVSCNPSGVPAVADARLQNLDAMNRTTLIHNVTADGARVFFETTEDLVDSDVDSINDVYEWQAPVGGGAPTLSLISSGNSIEYAHISTVAPQPNVLMGVSPDGSDVFFLSEEALAPGAGVSGASAIYDARIGGGFPPPPLGNPCLEVGTCRPVDEALPVLESAASPNVRGAGNVKPRKHRCKHRKNRKRRSCHRANRASRSGARESAVDSGAILEATGGESRSRDGERSQSPTEAFVSPREVTALATEFGDFGIESVAAGVSDSGAARHPDFTTTFVLQRAQSGARTEDIVVVLPPGLYGNPTLVPRCSTGDFVGAGCSTDSQIGVSRVHLTSMPPGAFITIPVFNLALPHPEDQIARFGMLPAGQPAFLDVSVRTSGDYGVTAAVRDANGQFPLEAAETILWGNPPDPSHDELRMTAMEAIECNGTPCKAPGGKRESGLDPFAFMTNPSACQQGSVGISVTSYQLPGQVFHGDAPMEPITDCQGLPFAPTFEAHPTSRRAGAPTGIETVLRLPQSTDPDVLGTATMREARVTLPKGMTISPGAADGLAACSEEQVGFHEEVDAACPDASKLGTATIVSPALPEPLEGAIYQRTPTPGHQFGLWLVTDELGLHVKLPGEIHPDPGSGQLTAVFSDLPQVPVGEIDFEIWGGDRAPLKNPDTCGTYAASYSFKPHSNDPALDGQSSMTIDEGCADARGFNPKLSGGVATPVAGAFSPFIFDLVRGDGEQDISALELTLPEGELAKLKGVPLCPDAVAADGACPVDSAIGHLAAAAGPGSFPLWIPQPGRERPAVYLAGPYAGAPYSIVSVVPAQAGPFDLGDVVVRSALAVDRETAVATVKADLPQIVEGVPISYRHLHVVVDRPNFMLNPTDCSEMQIRSSVTSTGSAVAHPSERFQVDDCKDLGFKPRLSLEVKGGMKRGDYPALVSVLKARKGDANLKTISVALPHSEFLAQEHIVTICTRKQFAARKCPKGSVYGTAKAWTPLLSDPLRGPVYLRSSDNPLPDLVMDLRGQIDVAVAGRIDSKNGGIRTTFESIPDAPVSKFVLRMKGGPKGLLTNSTDICRRSHRATVEARAQNGRAVNLRPTLKARCKK